MSNRLYTDSKSTYHRIGFQDGRLEKRGCGRRSKQRSDHSRSGTLPSNGDLGSGAAKTRPDLLQEMQRVDGILHCIIRRASRRHEAKL